MADEQKSAIIAFLGNAFHDSRVVNLIESLEKKKIKTKTISFDWKNPDFKTILGKTTVHKLDKSGSSLSYYLNFFYLLTKFLVRNKADYYFAEDVQTLPIVYFFAKLNGGKLFYNSREIYAHLGGLRNKSTIQSIISKVESSFIRKVDLVLVTGKMDAEYLKEAYLINNIFILRNLPKYQEQIVKIDLHERLNIPNDKKIILYQGVILEGRGILKIIHLLPRLTDIHFVIIGGGEFKTKFEQEARKSPAENRIHFIGSVNHSELLSYTAGADVGLSLIENISLSYYYALPNKLFEYIMACVPVIASNLPQMKNVIDEYKVGIYVDPEKEDEIINAINSLLENEEIYSTYKLNCVKASEELNWQSEFSTFEKYLT